MSNVTESILRKKIQEAFTPEVLALENESHMHSVPANSETHFKLLLVSEFFTEMSRIDRQRKVNEIIQEELDGPVHAFTQRVYTIEEWRKMGETTNFVSPQCLGGSLGGSI
ncbi:BolA family transcriptional regulator [Candidatus Kaiserbacteria bacterium]|nr:MAG: BolA family transcriptional regulator [Candidatus Kaiserbacteria bacterium]